MKPNPHTHDVFPLQGPRRRRWSIVRLAPWAQLPSAPLKLIEDLLATGGHLPEARDLLHLPTVAATTPFRLSPASRTHSAFARHRNLNSLASSQISRTNASSRTRRNATRIYGRRTAQGRSSSDFIAKATAKFIRSCWTQRDAARFFGEHPSARKLNVTFHPVRLLAFHAALVHRLPNADLTLELQTQLLYRGAGVYLNDEAREPRLARHVRLARPGLSELALAWYRWSFVHSEQT